MLALRRALSTDETDKMAMCLRANIVSLPQYKKANRIMAFLAMRGESNLDPLIGQALADEKVRAAYKRVGADPAEPAAPEVFAARAKRDGERWAPLIRRLNLVAE